MSAHASGHAHGSHGADGHAAEAALRPYGVIAMFLQPEQVVAAAKAAYAAGYRRMEAYSPMPVHGLSEALGFERNALPLVVLLAGICGGVGGLFLQWFASAVHYPIIVAGRPYASWPAFIPVTFELTVLFAAFGAVLGMLALNGLPRPHHPIFNAPNFALASRSRFFLCVQAIDPKFDLEETQEFLRGLGAREVSVVPIGEG
jgi:hypothetical protein